MSLHLIVIIRLNKRELFMQTVVMNSVLKIMSRISITATSQTTIFYYFNNHFDNVIMLIVSELCNTSLKENI